MASLIPDQSLLATEEAKWLQVCSYWQNNCISKQTVTIRLEAVFEKQCGNIPEQQRAVVAKQCDYVSGQYDSVEDFRRLNGT